MAAPDVTQGPLSHTPARPAGQPLVVASSSPDQRSQNHWSGAGAQGPGVIALDVCGGDVWAWNKTISGTCHGAGPEARIEVVVNGDAIPAVQAGNTFGATVRLRPGENTIRAVATGAHGTIVSNEVVHTVRLSPRPTARITVSIGDNDIALDSSGSDASDYDAAPITAYSWSFRPNHPGLTVALTADPAPLAGTGPRITVPLPEADGEYLVSLTITDKQGRQDTASVLLAVEKGRARHVDPLREAAGWMDGATIYGVIVRNTGAGRFQDVIDRLDDLADLGIAALWLAPVTRTLPGHFGYEVVDYFDVHPAYGTLADLKRLVIAAHARGIRVLLDFVPNDTSIEHPYYRDAERDGPSSPYHDFFDRDEVGASTHYFDWSHLPNLNFDNPEVRRFMTEAFMFWVREAGVDGFRADVAWGIERRRPDYWLDFSAEFHRVRPDGLLIAEASARDSYFTVNGFDAAYDWTDDLGVWAWTDAFDGSAPIAEGIRRALTSSHGDGYDPDSFVLRFLNNNDTGPRFITTHGVDRYRVASAMLLTLPGLPCVYTGDEVGAEFEPYAIAGAIDWTDRHNLRAHVRKLIRLRKELPGLGSRRWAVLTVEPVRHILGYLRFAADGTSPVLVLLNFGPDAVEAALAPVEIEATLDGIVALTDVYNGTSVSAGQSARPTISMPAWGIRVLVPTNDIAAHTEAPHALEQGRATR
ncbi:MAG: alpha-amylase [Chloroflexia bacterium]|nr:alpha-amylase [Chloroflexia bacterium]